MIKEDLTGKTFGKLTVTKMLYNYKNTHRTKCLCKCECGNECVRTAYQLKKTALSSCGCGKKEYIRNSCGREIDGMKFGRLLVLETIWDAKPPMVKCLCDCGNIVTLRKSDVQSLHTQSCGCLQSERSSISNEVDHSNDISDYGVKIIKKYKKNELGQWIWECECGVCGNHFFDLPARVLNGHVRSCGCLKRSSNEIFISNCLNELNVEYEEQYTFIDCRSGKNYPLYFDFAVFNNGKLLCLIEYDGMQHFVPNNWFGGEEAFVESKQRDALKDEYCKSNNLTLYRLPYYMNNDEIRERITKIVNP